MTPDKRKKALPTSQSSEGSDRPQTAQQWRLNLHRIKVSYLNGQWKKCSSRCQDLLQATHDQVSDFLVRADLANDSSLTGKALTLTYYLSLFLRGIVSRGFCTNLTSHLHRETSRVI